MIISQAELISWIAGLLLHAVWLATVISLAAWAWLRHVRDPRTAHAVAAGGLLVIAMGLLGMAIATWPKATTPLTATITPAAVQTVASPWPPPPQTSAPVAAPPRATLTDWRAYLVLAWSCGVIVLSLRHVGGCWRVLRLRQTAHQIGGEMADRFRVLSRGAGVKLPLLLSSTNLAVPIAIGWWRPAVIVPASLMTGLPQAQLEALLLHELAHLRRQDWLLALAASVLETLLFFHPAVWWLNRRLRQARELCCDAQAVCAGAEPEGLARALLALAERLAPGGPVLAATGGVLADRVRQILGLPERRQQPWRALVAIILLPLLLAIVSACSTASPARLIPTLPLTSSPLESPSSEPTFPLARRIRANAFGHRIVYDFRLLSKPLEFWADHGLAGDQPKRLDAMAVKRLLARDNWPNGAQTLESPQLNTNPLQRAYAVFMHRYPYTKDYRLVEGRLEPEVVVLNYGSAFEVCGEPVEGGILLTRVYAVRANVLSWKRIDFPWSGDGKEVKYPIFFPQVRVEKATLAPDTRLAFGETIAMPLVPSWHQGGMPTFGPVSKYFREHGVIPDFHLHGQALEERVVCLLTVQQGDVFSSLSEPPTPANWLDRTRVTLDLDNVPLDQACFRLKPQLPVEMEVRYQANWPLITLTAHNESVRTVLNQLLSQGRSIGTATGEKLQIEAEPATFTDQQSRLSAPQEAPAEWLDRTRIELDLHDVPLEEAVSRLAVQLPVKVEVVRDADYAATRVNLTVHGETARVALNRLLSQCLLYADASNQQLRLGSGRARDMSLSHEPGTITPQSPPSAPGGW